MIRNTPVVHGHNHIRGGYVPTLSISVTLMSGVSEEGQIFNMTIDVADATQVWSYIIDAAWITVIGASLIGDDTIKVTIEPQPAGAQPPRTGHITFSSQYCADKVLTINQLARTA